MVIIGIDPGRRTGVCVLDEYQEICNTIDLGKHDSAQLLRLYDELWHVIRQYLDRDLLVVYEEPAMLRGKALIQIQRQLGVIMYMCEEASLPHYPVNQATLKAWVRKQTGNAGKMDKPAMMDSVPASVLITDDNQADAYWLAMYGRSVVAPIAFQ